MSEIGEFREYVEEQRNLCYGVEGTTPGVHGRIARQYDFLLETIDTYQEIEQPQLNDNQKALVIWMQENECYNGDPLESISDLFLEGTPSEHFPDLPLSCVEAAYQSLNNQQKIEMVQKYLEQYFEQEEEK
ncbi:hypothetical protein [Enterococcus gallinarum]|uniref:hypothetical protein n=1 Tax=Enterococcus gallinarum TaxID=1353 RepID=UPI001CAA47B1|nr:hypothetical protein [Enterococcus gallinarum]